ncbi:hypothetical protein HLRTI_001341 [Halorhabdus tiamatea SARL4B]|uniref:Uncharacterized protein n=1 Tax=Halorhabdus tiamatea SARL4B TaxID=1033806 RepID=U2F966_9EURY|nr:hypothetical protein [Halorhabdus tiamatea]ERJ06635.1 hypothetical protein HLRTI_001341 [Halorhabdus tiamatea SARL4B]
MTPENLPSAVQRAAADQLTNTDTDTAPNRVECREAVLNALALWGDSGFAAEAWVDEQANELYNDMR